MAPMRTAREGQQSMRTETNGGNLPKTRNKDDINRLKLPEQVPETVKHDCERMVLCVCVWGVSLPTEQPQQVWRSVHLRHGHFWMFG